MSTPAIFYLILNSVSVGIIIADPDIVKQTTPTTKLVALSIEIGLLYWGGFFS